MIFWNVRGLNRPSRKRDIINHVSLLQPCLVDLLETKVKAQNSSRIINSLPPRWDYCNNYEFSSKGRIWVAWSRDIWTTTILHIILQMITVKLLNKAGLTIILSVIYGENTEAIRTFLWNDIKHIYDTFPNIPWLLVGDFNICRFSEEKIGGKDLSVANLRSFNDCISLCGLTDTKSIGSNWTWHNNQMGDSRIYGET